MKDWRNIDIRDLYAQSAAVRYTVAALVMLLVLLPGAVLFLREPLDGLVQAETEETLLKQEFMSKNAQLGNLHELQAELQRLEQSLALLQAQVPERAQTADLLTELAALGSESGVRIEQIAPMEVQPEAGLSRLPFQVAVSGSYAQVRDFVRRTAAQTRIMVLSELTLTADGARNDRFRLSAVLGTYQTERAAERDDAAASAASATGN